MVSCFILKWLPIFDNFHKFYRMCVYLWTKLANKIHIAIFLKFSFLWKVTTTCFWMIKFNNTTYLIVGYASLKILIRTVLEQIRIIPVKFLYLLQELFSILYGPLRWHLSYCKKIDSISKLRHWSDRK